MAGFQGSESGDGAHVAMLNVNPYYSDGLFLFMPWREKVFI